MQELEVYYYCILKDIQGICIPKLVCYGYLLNTPYFAIGTTFVGKSLEKFKTIARMQEQKAYKALDEIHKRGVLHNDIRKENIILCDDGKRIFLIDFGMATFSTDREKQLEEKIEMKYCLSDMIDDLILK